MAECGKSKLLGFVPLRGLRNALLARHFEGCLRCGAGMADVREARSVTWSAEDFEGRSDPWPRVRGEILGRRPEARGRLVVRWRLAAAAAAVSLAAAGLFLFDFDRNGGPALPTGLKFSMGPSRIYDQPAQAFIFQTRDDDATFVWVEKQQ